ncbi:phage tail protein I [Arthrobacter sp. SLBN-112]|jgi:phage tail-like protein|uniref:phage tail protein I n=1 Tax=Arthrobacter sp. SLBN-112 TaxID=2768452 RepID=UPI001F34DC3A|nr:phage tail protein I [Arthrobacter sp. SLBN-112]
MIKGLRSAVPLVPQLPAVLQEDAFLQRFLLAFDDALAPVFTALDGLSSYIDPRLAPEDFLNWLADWVGVRVDETWPAAQRRNVVANAAAIHRRRGTVAGVADAVRLAVGGVLDVRIEDSGGATWSPTPGGRLPGNAPALLHVRVYAAAIEDVNLRRLEGIINAVKPAHIPHTLEVLPRVTRLPDDS